MKKTYIQLAIAGVVLVAAVVAYLAWFGAVSSQSTQIAQIEGQIKEKSQATARIAETKAKLAALAPQEAAISQYFISTNDVVPFLEQLAGVGKFFGAKVDVLSVSANPGTPYGTLNLSLTISGSFDAVMRTLGTIEYGPYDITTSSVTFDTTGDASGSTGTWTAAGTFTLATLPQSQIVQSPATPATPAAPAVPTAPVATTTTTKSATTSVSSGSVATPTI